MVEYKKQPERGEKMQGSTICGIKWYKYDIREMTDAEFHNWYAMMSAEKQKRVDRFHFTDDKKRTVAGEMLARKAISQRCGVSAECISFMTGENDKPYAENLSVEFNISHSGDFVVCAVSDRPVGIDIERVRPIDLKIAKKICTPDEMQYLFGHIPSEDELGITEDREILERFFSLWTQKEAYGKCTGEGLFHKSKKSGITEAFIPDDDYIIAICYE